MHQCTQFLAARATTTLSAVETFKKHAAGQRRFCCCCCLANALALRPVILRPPVAPCNAFLPTPLLFFNAPACCCLPTALLLLRNVPTAASSADVWLCTAAAGTSGPAFVGRDDSSAPEAGRFGAVPTCKIPPLCLRVILDPACKNTVAARWPAAALQPWSHAITASNCNDGNANQPFS